MYKRQGLKAAEGEYFCVLDGDDYYTIPDKLQRQIDFFDLDQKEEYVAVATQFIIDLGNGMVSVPDRSSYTEFSYADFLTQHSGYYHTADVYKRQTISHCLYVHFDFGSWADFISTVCVLSRCAVSL